MAPLILNLRMCFMNWYRNKILTFGYARPYVKASDQFLGDVPLLARYFEEFCLFVILPYTFLAIAYVWKTYRVRRQAHIFIRKLRMHDRVSLHCIIFCSYKSKLSWKQFSNLWQVCNLLYFLCGAHSIRVEQSKSLSWYHITAVPLPFVLSYSPSGEVSNELWMSRTVVAGAEVLLLHRNLLCNLCTLCREMRAIHTATGAA